MSRNGMAALAVAAITVLTVTGCTIANTTPQNIGISYNNGPLDSRTFEACNPPGERTINGAFSDQYFYPAGQRTFNFSGDEGADSKSLSVATSSSIELIASGTVTFHLNTSCDSYTDKAGKEWPGGRLQKFHQTIGAKLKAYSEDENADNGGEGWNKFVNTYIKDVVDRALDTNGQKYEWALLYTNNETRQQWEKGVLDTIPDLVKAQLGDDLVVIDNILLQKPGVPGALKAELENNEAAQLAAKTADTNKAAAANWPGGINAYIAYQRALAVNKAIESGKVKVLPVPDGSDIIINSGN